jgi:3-hydroxyisobutyrate dehydrogenase-like beta-hydroxyacid dehydrogenase
MGFAMACCLLREGFDVVGFDLRQDQMDAFVAKGGEAAATAAEVGAQVDAAFVMVMNGPQVHSVVCGDEGLLTTMPAGSTIIISATIIPDEIRQIEQACTAKGVEMIDTPVTGGLIGASAGTLVLMTAAKQSVFDAHKPLLDAVGATIHHVGEEIGAGQSVKAALQALIGSTLAGLFEALALGAKAGVKGQVMYDVFTSGWVSSPLLRQATEWVMDRKFSGTGSSVHTMNKDLSISLRVSDSVGSPLFVASAAHELFKSGAAKFPEEDNWAVTKVIEEISGAKVAW